MPSSSGFYAYSEKRISEKRDTFLYKVVVVADVDTQNALLKALKVKSTKIALGPYQFAEYDTEGAEFNVSCSLYLLEPSCAMKDFFMEGANLVFEISSADEASIAATVKEIDNVHSRVSASTSAPSPTSVAAPL